MTDFIETLTDPAPQVKAWTLLVTAIVTATYIFLFDKILKRQKERRRKNNRNNNFFVALGSAIELSTVANSNDVISLYKGAHRISPNEKSIESSLIQELEFYLVAIHEIHSDDTEFIQKVSKFVKGILRELNTQAPFSNLPDTERIMLIDIINHSKSSNRKLLEEKVNDLSEVLKMRTSKTEALEASVKTQTLLNVAGLVLSLVFGSISLLQYIFE